MKTETVEEREALQDGAEAHIRKVAKKSAEEPAAIAIQLQRLPMQTLLVPVVGTSPLIVHKFSEKAKKQMLDAMQNRKNPKEPKDPEAEYLAAFYHIWKRDESKGTLERDGYGFPVIAFKAATIGGGRFYSGVTMVALRQYMFFKGEAGDGGQQMARIESDAGPKMREDVVRVNRGGSDLRYRPMFEDWRTTLRVSYVTSALTRDSVLNLIDAGGFGVGVGEWRPEKSGDFGTYQIDTTRDIQVIGG